MHKLGFHPTPYHKGVYVDGHEHHDVVNYSKLYMTKLDTLESTHLPPQLCSDGNLEEAIGDCNAKPKLTLIYHDESIFHANEGPSWQWAEEGTIRLDKVSW